MTLIRCRIAVFALLAALLAACGGSSGAGGSDNGRVGTDTSEGGDDVTTQPDVGETGTLSVEIVIDKLKGNAPLTVNLDAKVTGCDEADAEFRWTLGTGTILKKKTPGEYVFPTAGGYNVKLEVTCTPTGDTGSDTVQVVVLDSAQIALTTVHLTSPSTVAPGDTMTFTFDVLNKGDVISTPFKVQVVLSKDENYQADKDVVLSETTIEKMDDGRYKESKRSFVDHPAVLPADTAEGSYFLFVVADPDDAVAESNEKDNVAVVSAFITVSASSTDKPDLTISPPVFVSGAQVAVGKGLGYSMDLTNAGKAPAKGFKYTVWASLDDQLSADDIRLIPETAGSVFNLDPTKSFTIAGALVIPVGTSAATYHAIGQVDVNDSVAETDETNNLAVAAGTFTVFEETITGFDLAVQSIALNPHDTYWGGSVKVTTRVANPGNKATPGYSMSFFLAEEPTLNPYYDTKIHTIQVEEGLAPGEEKDLVNVVSIPSGMLLKPGDYYLSVVLDLDGTLDELDEQNNWKVDQDPLHVFQEAFVDVGLAGLFVHPEVVAAGKEIKVSYTASNTGSTSSGAYIDYIVLSQDSTISMADIQAKKDIVIGKVANDGIGPSAKAERVEKVPISIALPHEIGQYWVGVIGDAEGNLNADKNKSNQILVSSSPLVVLGPQGGCFEDTYEPNGDAAHAGTLVSGSTTGPLGLCGGEDWFKVAVLAGQTVVATVDLESPLYLEPKPYDLDFELRDADGTVIDTADAAGDTDTAAAFAVPSDGFVYIRVYPKSLGSQAHYTLTVTAEDPGEGVDLSPIHVKAAPDAIYPGGLVVASMSVVNLGKEPAPATKAAVLLVGGEAGTSAQVGMINVPEVPGGTKVDVKGNVLLPVTTAGGSYVLQILVDAEGKVVESDEANNSGTSGAITVDESMVCEDDGYEPNDDIDNATPLPGQSGAYAALTVCPDLPDVYRVELPAGVSFSASVSYEHKVDKGFVAAEVLDATGQVLDAAATSTAPLVGLPFVFDAGVYYVRVRVNPTTAGKAGPYKYSLALKVDAPLPGDVCNGDVHEPNNGFEAATAIGCGLNRLTLCKKDRDYYKVALAKGTTLTVTLGQTKDEMKLALYTVPNGQPTKPASGTSTLQYTAEEDVVVYLLVEPKSVSSGVTQFDYTLSVDGVSGMDLSIGPLTLTPTEVYQGEDVLVEFQVENACMDPVPGYDFQTFLSANETLDLTDVLLLATTVDAGLEAKSVADHTVKALVPLETAPGNYSILVALDPADVLEESQEDNNLGGAPLVVAKLCLNDPLEPDNAPLQAATIEAGTFGGLVVCPYDVDWYRVKVREGAILAVTMTSTVADGDLDLRLYAASNTSVPVAQSATQSDVEAVSWQAPAAADYLIRVNGFLAASNTYTLVIETP